MLFIIYEWEKSLENTLKSTNGDKIPREFRGTQEWHHKDVDRVRIEFKLKRIAFSKKYKLSTLQDLLINPKFAIIASDYIQFKNFKFSTKLPQDWEDYLSEDRQGNQESFMQEVLSTRNGPLKNISQYIEDNKRMQSLKKRIIDIATTFDNDWGKGYGPLKKVRM